MSTFRLKRDSPDSFNADNFVGVGYTDDKGEFRPMYEMTRDGFALLAMGFTGKTATAWKIKYIEAFNKMERIASDRGNMPMFCSHSQSVPQWRNLAPFWANGLACLPVANDHPKDLCEFARMSYLLITFVVLIATILWELDRVFSRQSLVDESRYPSRQPVVAKPGQNPVY